MKENKFNVGDTIVLKEGNVEGYYIVIACAIGDYVLVNKNGNHSIRVLSKIFVDQHSKYTTEQQAKALVDMCSKAGISSEDLGKTCKAADTSEENYNDKLVREHKELTVYLNSLYKSKNKKYGDSFGKSVRKRGLSSAIQRMEEKWNRLDNLVSNHEDGSDTDESLQDTLLDLANYCIMTVMELNHMEENTHDTKNYAYGNNS